MDNRFLGDVLNEMQPFFDEQGFKAFDDGVFKSETRVVKVEYNEERQMFVLSKADINEDGEGELSEANAWLFDDGQNAKDAQAVGIDFTETLRKDLGIRHTRSANVAVELPASSKDGVMSIAGFTKKVLDIYPQFKDEYKAHVGKYGNFLYLDFFGYTLVPQIKTTLKENNKKSVKKLYELLENAYLIGDRETVNTVVAVVAAAACESEEIKSAAIAMLEGDSHLQKGVIELIPVIDKNKKLRASLIK